MVTNTAKLYNHTIPNKGSQVIDLPASTFEGLWYRELRHSKLILEIVKFYLFRKRLHQRLVPFLSPFSETEMRQEALLHQGETCREFLSQFMYCNSNLVKIHFILLNPGMKSAKLDWGPSDQAAEQSYFLKE